MNKAIRVLIAQSDTVTSHKTVYLSVPEDLNIDFLQSVIEEDLDQFYETAEEYLLARDETDSVEVISTVDGEDHYAGEINTWLKGFSEVVPTAD